MNMESKPKIFHVTKTPRGLDGILRYLPSLIGQHYCAVVNVSDSPCASFDYQMHIPSFWFPINEIAEWGHSPFYGTLRVVNEYWKGDKPVLIHCHAGANRSPSIAYAILLAKGYSLKEAADSLNYPDIHEVFERNLKRKHIPKNIIQFLREADKSETKLESLHFVLRRMDALYAEWSQRKHEEQSDYPLAADGSTRLVYDDKVKKYVIRKVD